MSYILNALRKSEKERQALQPETATDRILVQGIDQSVKSFNWKTLFIVSNLVIFAAIIIAASIWIGQKQKVEVRSSTPAPSSKAAAAPVDKKILKQSTSEIKRDTQPSTKSQEPRSPTIAELAAAKQAAEHSLTDKATVQKEPAPVRSRPSGNEKTTSVKIKEIKASGVQAETAPSAIFRPDAAKKDKKTELAKANDGKIPFIDALPEAFRRSVPKMTINVFVYTPEPSERFVMINMVKYKVGQQTPDGVEIKEIRNHSLVVGYNGRTFQIGRS